MALSTVSGILTRIGMGRLGRLGLEPAGPLRALAAGRARPHRRQEARPDRGRRRLARPRRHASTTTRPAPTARAAGADGRLGVRPRRRRRLQPARLRRSAPRREGRRPRSASSRRAVAFYRRHGIRVERVLTDNGAAYVSIVHAIACRSLGIRHLRTRPYRPQTNGKAERFIRTLLNGWAYGAIYGSSHERTPPLTAGSGTTTIDDDTQPSATNPRSAEPTCSGPTSRSSARYAPLASHPQESQLARLGRISHTDG